MKAMPLRGFALLPLLLASSAFSQALPYLFESDGTGQPNKLYWQTEPGVRYDLWKSDDLSEWQRVTGYPAVAEGLAMEHAFTPEPGGKGFFKMIPIDEQAPTVTGSTPGQGAFGVARFGSISLSLADATGINPASIQLTVGARGTFRIGSAELSYSNGVLTFDGGGDTALGAYGETLTVSLQVADTLGNAGVLAFTFDLETQPQLAPDLFIFGSPGALRAGQQVGAIATRALIQGPVRMNGGDPWTLESVAADRVVLAYTGANAPFFVAGTYICNRTPATLSEIFYRKITAVNDDPATKKLTLLTVDVGLEEIITDGSFSTAFDGLAFQVAEDGTIVQALPSRTMTLGDLGYSLDGNTFELTRSDGLTLLSAQFEQLHWWLKNCRFQGSIDLGLTGGLRRMEGVFEGDLDSAMIYNAAVALTGQALEDEIFDLPFASEPKVLVPLGPVAFALVKFDLKLRAEAEAAALINFRAGYRQSGRIDGLGCRYDKPDFAWINNVNFSPTVVEPFNAQLSGSLSLKLKLAPSVSFLVYGLAGAELALEPNGGLVIENDSQNILNSRLEAGVDLRLSSAGPALDWIKPQPSLVRTLWQTEWPLTSNQPPAPAITTQPKDVVANVGGSARFTCAVNRSDNVTWQWYQGSSALPGQNKSYLDLANLAASHAGNYSVRATVGGTPLQSTSASLTVLNNLGDLADYFQYPIGDRQWKAEFPDYPPVSERNTLYPDNPALDETTRAGKGAASGWFNYQDVGSWYPGYGIHPAEDWNKAGGDTGQPVYPIAKGKVVKISPSNSGNIAGIGWDVVVEHRLAESIRKPGDSESYYSIYTHLSPRANGTLVASLADESVFPYQVGSSVSMSNPIGYIGATTGVPPHLHLELRKKLPGKTITDGTSLYTATGNGYFDEAAGASVAFSAMQAEGITDPSDFIDDHGGAAASNPATDGFALIPAGWFEMGDSLGEGMSYELPVHSVYVSAFYMGRYEVTQALWDEVRAWGLNHGYTDLLDSTGLWGAVNGPNYPVDTMPWYEIVKWCNARSEKESRTPCYRVDGAVYKTGWSDAVTCNWNADGYRLPTEAEWERAARGGMSGKRFPWGNTINHNEANFSNYGGEPYQSGTTGPHPLWSNNNDGNYPYASPVGSFAPNGYGLYDMAGNVWEWCWDLFDSYPSTSQTDPRGPDVLPYGSSRVTRGGGWGSSAWYSRCAIREYYWPVEDYIGVGFRLARGQP